MSKKRIDFVLLDRSSIDIRQNFDETYFMIGQHRAIIPPHCTITHHFTNMQIVCAFVEIIENIGTSVIAAYLYDLIKNKKIDNLKINGKIANTKHDISKSLEDEENN